MTKYMIIYMMGPKAIELAAQMKQKSPEEMKKDMEPWMKWQQNLGAHLVEEGAALAKER